MLVRIWRNWNLHSFLIGLKNGASTLQDNPQAFPQKLTHKVTMWPSSYTCKDIPKRNENTHQHKNLYINILAALFIIAPNGNNPNVHQLIKWVNKMWYIHILEYYVSIERNEVHITAWMNLENIMLSERSQTHKHMIPFIGSFQIGKYTSNFEYSLKGLMVKVKL